MSTTTDNTGNVPWKPLVSQRWSLDDRGFVTKEDGEVPHRTQPFPPVFTEVESVTQNERDVHKTRRIVEKLLPQPVVDRTLGTAWGELERFAESWTRTKTMDADNTIPPSPSLPPLEMFYVVVWENTEHNPANYKKDVVVVSAWEPRTTLLYDDELGLPITLVESVVANTNGVPPALPAPTATAWSTIREVDYWRSIKSAYTLTGAYVRVTYDTIQYTFPAVFGGLTLVSSFEAANERTVWQITPQVRPAFTVPVYQTIYEELITAAQANTLQTSADNVVPFGSAPMPSSVTVPTGDLGTAALRARLFNPKPIDIGYNGLQVELHVPNVLTDEMSFTFTTSGSDTYYGPGIVETVFVPATEVSATMMLGLAASRKVICVEDTIDSWKHGMFMRRRAFIKVESIVVS